MLFVSIILNFHKWPNSRQKRLILKKLKVQGLKKTNTVKSFKIWLFEWSGGGLKPSYRAKNICKGLKNFPI